MQYYFLFSLIFICLNKPDVPLDDPVKWQIGTWKKDHLNENILETYLYNMFRNFTIMAYNFTTIMDPFLKINKLALCKKYTMAIR